MAPCKTSRRSVKMNTAASTSSADHLNSKQRSNEVRGGSAIKTRSSGTGHSMKTDVGSASKKSYQKAKLSPQTKATDFCPINRKEKMHDVTSNLLLLAKLSDQQERIVPVRPRRVLKCPARYEEGVVKNNSSKTSKAAAVSQSSSPNSCRDSNIVLSPDSKGSLKSPKRCYTVSVTDAVTPGCSKAKTARKSCSLQSETKGKETKYTKGPVVIVADKHSVIKKQVKIQQHSRLETMLKKDVSKDTVSVCGQTNQGKDVGKKPDLVVHTFPSVRKVELSSSKPQHVVKVIADSKLIRSPKITTIKKVTLPKFKSYTNACVVQFDGKTFVLKAPPGQGQLTPKRVVHGLLPFVKDKDTALKDMVIKEIKTSKSNNAQPSQKFGKFPPETETMSGVEAILRASELTSMGDTFPTPSSGNAGKCYITYPVYSGKKYVSYSTVRMSELESFQISRMLNKFAEKGPKGSDKNDNDKNVRIVKSTKPQNDAKQVAGDSKKDHKVVRIVKSTKPQNDAQKVSGDSKKDNKDVRIVKSSKPQNNAKQVAGDSSYKTSKQQSKSTLIEVVHPKNWQQFADKKVDLVQNSENGKAILPFADYCKPPQKTIVQVDDPQNWQQFASVKGLAVSKHPCENCDMEFTSRTKLRLHVRKEHAVKLQKWFKCFDCNLQFGTNQFLKDHQLLAHKISQDLLKPSPSRRLSVENNTSESPVKQMENCHKCSDCKCVLPSSQRLHDHMVKFHRNKVVLSDLILCEPCDEAFMLVKDFLLHKKDVHNLVPNMSRIGPRRTFQLGDASTESELLSTDTDKSSSITLKMHHVNEKAVEHLGNSITNDDEMIQPIKSMATDMRNEDDAVGEADADKSHQTLEKDVPVVSEATIKDNVYCDLEIISKDDLNSLLVVSSKDTGVIAQANSDGTYMMKNSVTNQSENNLIQKTDNDNYEITSTQISLSDSVSILGAVAVGEKNVSNGLNEKENKLFYCDVCDKHIKNLHAHILAHTGERPFKCTRCSLAFRSNACLKIHHKRHSKQQIRFTCPECGRTFLLESNLNRHIADCRARPHRCKKCSKAYSLPEDLEIHLKVHEMESPFKCDECGHSFFNVERLESHVKKNAHPAIIAALDVIERHLVERHVQSVAQTNPNNPEVSSDHSYGSSSSPLHGYVKSSSEKSENKFYRCKICDKVGNSLRTHMMTHITETPIKCKECDKGFKTKCALKNHTFTHQETAWHQCPYCEKKYLHATSMQRHLVNHTGVYPHKCIVCERGFVYLQDMYRHVSTHEGYEEWKPETDKIIDSVINLNPNINRITCGTDPNSIDCTSGPFVCCNCSLRFKEINDLADHTLFECNFCGKIGRKSGNILAHLKEHSDEKPYKCNMCDSSFKSYFNLKSHRATHKKSEHKCPKCSKVFKLKIYFKRHMCTHCERQPFQCHLCDKAYRYKGDLDRHMAVHLKNKPFICYHCSKSFPTRSRLKTHCMWSHRKVDSGSRLYMCNICGKNSSSFSQLKAHVKVHSREKPYQCEICCSQFRTKNILYGHMKVHSDERPYKCTLCPKQYKSSGSLLVHQWVHTGIKPFPCKICGKSYPDQNKLYVHMRNHTGEAPYDCSMCCKRFISKAQRNSHMFVHTGEKKFPCNVCGRSFSQRGNLIIHCRIHTGERPYKCSFCESSFRISSRLKDHIRIHTGERPFTCDVCPNAYIARKQLQSHMKTHSRHVPYKCKRCHKMFVLKENLDQHFQVHKKEEQEAQNLLQADQQLNQQLKAVSIRGFGKSVKSLTENISVVESNMPHTCASCNRRFATDEELNIHKKSHLLKPFQCAVCSETFSNPDLLSTHLIKHVQSGSYMCHQCEQVFDDEDTLRMHSLSHSDKQEYFVSGRQSRTHKRGGKKQFSCDVCKKSFSVQSLLSAHKKIHIPVEEEIVESTVLDDFIHSDSQAASSLTEKMFMSDVAKQEARAHETSNAGPVVFVEYRDSDFLDGKDVANEEIYYAENAQESIVIQQGVSETDQQPYITIQVPPEYNQNINELISQASDYLDILTQAESNI